MTSGNDYYCMPAFMVINVPQPRGPILILGDTFLKKFYTVFDRDAMQIGFALANKNTSVDMFKRGNLVDPYENGGGQVRDDLSLLIEESKKQERRGGEEEQM